MLEALENTTNCVIDPYTSRAKRQQLSEAVSTVKTQIKIYRYSENFRESFAQAAESCYQNVLKYEQCMSALAANDYKAFRNGDCEKLMEPCRQKAPDLLENVYKIYSERDVINDSEISFDN